eukprot:s515_g17.t1
MPPRIPRALFMLLAFLVTMVMPAEALQRPCEKFTKFDNLHMPIQFRAQGAVNHHNPANSDAMQSIHFDSHFGKNDQFFQCGCVQDVVRVGEASNPGPMISFRTFNPAQLLGHEEEIAGWPDGVWTAAETSHTAAAMQVTERRFRQHDVRTIFSAPVEKHSNNAGSYRGKAMGTAIMSRLYMTPYPMELEESVKMSCRFSDALVHLGHGLRAYVCVTYGPPINNYTYEDGERVFLNSILPGLQRATMFRGPAVITGDFNRDLGDCVFWESLRAKGWYDCAELAWQRHQKLPEPTCKDASRRSFILVNRAMAEFFMDCGVVEQHMFDAHPVLEATFQIHDRPCSKTVWSLCRSLDDYMFDDDLLQQHAHVACDMRSSKFFQAVQDCDAEEMFKQFAFAFEDTFRQSAVDVEGNRTSVPTACLKRYQAKVVQKKPLSAPVIKTGRNGDVNVPFGQTSLQLRRRVKQGRRLLSLCRQMKAREENPHYGNLQQCNMLWKAICAASGFHKGFQVWVHQELGWFVPTMLPERPYVDGLYEMFHDILMKEVREEKYQQLRAFNKMTLEDIAKGGGKAFKAVKERAAPPPTFLAHDVKQPLQWQRWTKQGVERIRYQKPCRLEVGMPVCFQGQSACLTETDDNFLYLDRPVVCKSRDDMVVTQTQLEARPNEMQKLICDAWNQFWQAPDDVPDDAVAFVQSLSDCETCPFQSFSTEAWRRCIKGVKTTSARGACAFSMKDMQRMPDHLLQWLFVMYEAFEKDTKWPKKLTLARVTMLAKPGEDCHRPLSVRPITILSVIYRLWSRYRSLQVIQHLGSSVPPQIGGIAARLSADCLTAYVCDLLEEAHDHGFHRCGLVLDLKKCFNLIPRSTLALLMDKLKLPYQYTRAHQNMLAGLERLVEIAGQVGDTQWSSCGVPEGCAYSVVSMVCMTILAAEVMGCRHTDIDVTMFADNWGLTTTTVELLCDAIQKLEKLVASLHMKISADKSWVWGTSPATHRELQHVQLDRQRVAVKLSARDLGCDISYSKQKCKQVTKKRLCKAVATLRKVRPRKLPRAFKGKMCATLGAGIAGYGSEFHKHTPKEMHRLRCATAEALGLYKSGANAWLAVNATGQFRDPQLQLLKRKVKFFRRFLRIFPAKKDRFLMRLVERRWKSGTGITRQLAETFNNVGWKWVDDRTMVHDCGLQMQWLEDSLPFVYRCLQHAWNYHVASQIQRPNFDVPTFDSETFAKCMKKRPVRQQGILQTVACGKHVTMDALSHYSNKVDSKQCPFCDQMDNKEHRVFHCPGLADVRAKYSEVVKWLKKQKHAVWAFALVPTCGQPLLHKRPLQIDRPLVCPALTVETAMVYTDGSAFFNEHWDCCVAGSAVIVWNETTGRMKEVTRQVLPFQDHSSYRAEVFSIILALERFWRMDVFSDCEAVVSQFCSMCDAILRGGQVWLGQHEDLWKQVEVHLRKRPMGSVNMFKVKAHVNMCDAVNPLQARHALGNNCADKSAKLAVTLDNSVLFKRMEAVVHSREVVRTMMSGFFDMLCDLGDRYYETKPERKDVAVCPDFASRVQVSGPFFKMPCMTAERIASCPYTAKFAQKFQDWMQTLEWGEGEAVSGIEMYIAFALGTKMMVPVQVKDKQYALRSDSVVADQFKLDLSRQSRVWLNFLDWWLQSFDSPLEMYSDKSLRFVGFSIAIKGFRKRPKMPNAVESLMTLWRKVVKRRVADAETETTTKDTKAPAATVQEEPAAQVPQRRVTVKGKPAEADGSGKRAQSQDGGEQSSPAQLREVRRKASSPSPCSSRSICARRTPSPSFRPRRMKGRRHHAKSQEIVTWAARPLLVAATAVRRAAVRRRAVRGATAGARGAVHGAARGGVRGGVRGAVAPRDAAGNAPTDAGRDGRLK